MGLCFSAKRTGLVPVEIIVIMLFGPVAYAKKAACARRRGVAGIRK